MTQIKIGLAQLECKDGQPEENLKRVEQVLREHGSTHDILVFPEGYVAGFPSPEVSRALAETLDGPTIQRLKGYAEQFQSTFLIGVYELDNDEVFNTSVLIDPEGLLMSYRKTHLWVGEENRVKPGDCIRVCNFRDTKIGILICYDIEFPEASRVIASMGADVLLLTNGNMDPYGPAHRVALKARAQENQIFVAMANRVGYQGTTFYVGESSIADPYGNIIAEAGNAEEVLSVTIDTSLVSESRNHYNYLAERRIRLFEAPVQFNHGCWEYPINDLR